MRQLHGKDRGLDFVQPEIAADEMMIITRLHPVLPERPQLLILLFRLARDEAGVTGGAKILRRIKTECPVVAHCSGLP